MSRVNYDEIGDLYDEPTRDHAVDPNLLTFLDSALTVSPPIQVLDIGWGTGKQLAADQNRFPDSLFVGVDRFRRMLLIASKRCPVASWIQADGAVLPLASASFHYVTSQFSYPHIGSTQQLLGEVFRALKPGGRFVMTNIDPWSMSGWFVYQYFPEARALDYTDFLPVEQFVELMGDVGLHNTSVQHADMSQDEDLRQFLAYASKRHRASQLMAISDEAYNSGLRRLEEAVANSPVSNIGVRSEFVLVTIMGEKPSV